MKYITLVIIFASQFVMAKTNTQLGTDFKFNPHSVRGNYQSSHQAVAAVENEKSLNKILKPRTDFKDRIRRELKMKHVEEKSQPQRKER